MKAEDVKVGMRVCLEGCRGEHGTVKALPEGDKVRVKWSYGSSNLIELDEIEAIDEEADKKKAAAMQAKINEATSAFEKAFEALHAIQDEVQRGNLHTFEEEKLIDMSKLHGVIDANGWSSSSLYC